MNAPYITLEDLILDAKFISWVKDPDTVDGNFWVNWAAKSEENQLVLEQAKAIILELVKDVDEPIQDELNDLWRRIEASNDAFDQEKARQNAVGHKLSLIKTWQKAAAVFVGFGIVVSLLFFLLNQKVSISTQYAENQKIQLPDGSFVVLNANSSVSFADDWDEQSPREVWLEGEAFFSVTHTANHQKFIVHTNDLDVQVLGTKFNVNARVSKTRVVLNSGKVKLFLRQEKNQEVDMKPGELVDFSSNNKAFVKKAVKTKVFSAWVNKELVFEDTSLEEIAQLLEDNYGYKVKFVNKELANLTFTGTANTENINLLFTILQKTFNISIQKQENNLIINN
ncbi:DUF4974 domain-containing protein [Pedobacter aquae]|uniref:DUF4974 domain-containing protein n=1 Tax=Pedobacter aquae TaxID=2605747 RepID=A0A5C0VH45_9SPHI|nr:FecR domain-containing protein [Pedobacter aquae]QEK51369.1 DUF4974 domain-containing protein [Pedobacter aquae]